MNYFLILIILLLCGGGYYEYTSLQTKDAQDVQVAKLDLQAQIDKLTQENKKLADDKTAVAKSLDSANTTIADLTTQLQTAQTKLAAQMAQAAKVSTPAAGTATMTAPPPSSNSLGTFTSLDGKTFPNSQLLKVATVGITISYDGGITEIMFTSLPPELQKRFGFDPHLGAQLTTEQAQALDSARQAAAGK